MPKFTIVKPWSDDGYRNWSALYNNCSDSAIIRTISFNGTVLERERHINYLALTLDTESFMRALLANIPYDIKIPVIHISEILGCVARFSFDSVHQSLLTQFFSALDKLDPFDKELIQELASVDINLDFSGPELNQLIVQEGIDQAMKIVHERCPWQFFLLADTYVQLLEQKKENTEEEIFSFLRCYAMVSENDVQYRAANQAIIDFIMGLNLDQFSEDTQFHLRGETLKSTMKLGYFDEAYHLLPGLCGYGLSVLPFPKMTSISKDELLEQMVSMAGHINKLNQEMKGLKSENGQLNTCRSISPDFFNRTKSTGSINTDTPQPTNGRIGK